jgi:hypothetical protein
MRARPRRSRLRGIQGARRAPRAPVTATHSLIASLLLIGPAQAAASTVTIERAIPQADGSVAIDGRGFGAPCGKCEVIAVYDDGLRYAAPVASWTDARIVARIPDVNRGTSVRLAVHTPSATSNTATVTLPRRIDVNLAFSHRSEAKVGDTGEKQLDVAAALPSCGARAPVFERAEIKHLRRRFGEAQIVAAPPPGCTSCQPLTVRWYHEPTGYLEFRVDAYRRWVEGVCADRVR